MNDWVNQRVSVCMFCAKPQQIKLKKKPKINKTQIDFYDGDYIRRWVSMFLFLLLFLFFLAFIVCMKCINVEKHICESMRIHWTLLSFELVDSIRLSYKTKLYTIRLRWIY